MVPGSGDQPRLLTMRNFAQEPKTLQSVSLRRPPRRIFEVVGLSRDDVPTVA
jgi:hypothetical protein